MLVKEHRLLLKVYGSQSKQTVQAETKSCCESILVVEVKRDMSKHITEKYMVLISLIQNILRPCILPPWYCVSILNLFFRSIRDDENRVIRKTSIAPDQAFICEETILEDLCQLSGLEARGLGNKVNGGVIL